MLCDQARNDPEGFEDYRDKFDCLSSALAEEGIEWQELDFLHESDEHHYSGEFPYGYLMHLRRAFTLTRLGELVTPVADTSDEQYQLDKEKVMDETTICDSHLLSHADYAGYYIPVDFDDPEYLSEMTEDGAEMVGSSQQLLAELVSFAPSIGIQLDEEGVLTVAQEEIVELTDGGPFCTERYAWLVLYRACLASIKSGHAIVFG